MDDFEVVLEIQHMGRANTRIAFEILKTVIMLDCIAVEYSAETKRTLIDIHRSLKFKVKACMYILILILSNIAGATFNLSFPVELGICRTIESLYRHL